MMPAANKNISEYNGADITELKIKADSAEIEKSLK
jgi:hypothetical protein